MTREVEHLKDDGVCPRGDSSTKGSLCVEKGVSETSIREHLEELEVTSVRLSVGGGRKNLVRNTKYEIDCGTRSIPVTKFARRIAVGSHPQRDVRKGLTSEVPLAVQGIVCFG